MFRVDYLQLNIVDSSTLYIRRYSISNTKYYIITYRIRLICNVSRSLDISVSQHNDGWSWGIWVVRFIEPRFRSVQICLGLLAHIADLHYQALLAGTECTNNTQDASTLTPNPKP